MHQLLFVHRVINTCEKKEWVFTRKFEINFVPFVGLAIRVQLDDAPKEWSPGFDWRIGPNSQLFWNPKFGCFVSETKQLTNGQPPNDIESFSKILLSQGWVLTQEPV